MNRAATPLREKRIGTVHRGAGPRDLIKTRWRSFDGHLLASAEQRGARAARQRVTDLRRDGGRWEVVDKAGDLHRYDLVAVASGINSGIVKLLEKLPIDYRPPRGAKTFIREYYLGGEVIDRLIGNSMHVFLLDRPGLEFAAVIPKGEYATGCLLGSKLDGAVLQSVLDSPAVRSCFPADWSPDPGSCQCAPKISVRGAQQPFADGLVFVGDCDATRLY